MKNLLPVALALLLPFSLAAQSPSPSPDLTAAIRTPPAPPAPRINGPRVYGARPGHPFFYHLPITGQRPISITARDLPDSLTLDPATGNITGVVAEPGKHTVTFKATNAVGTAIASIQFVIGPVICLTPPLGWNSWNIFAGNINEAKIRGAADAMVATGLIEHGWTYINMDDKWEGQRDATGDIQSSAAIPDVKALAAYIHGKGLKLGIYSSPGPYTCAGAIGSWRHEDQDAATYAAWGIDYLKYDWCSYGGVADMIRENKYAGLLPKDKSDELMLLNVERNVLDKGGHIPDLPKSGPLKDIAGSNGLTKDQLVARKKELDARIKALHADAQKRHPAEVAAMETELYKEPYATMRASLDKVDRDIVFSFCQYGMDKVWEWGAATGGNLWRSTGDISAYWKSVEGHGFNQNGLEQWAGPGHWNDPDMLEVGNGNLTPDENYTHMTLWCMLSAPLLIGCDMPKMSPFIVSLFSNDEVLAVNQDALGKQGWRVKQDGQTEVWMKPLADHSLAVAFFNRGNSPTNVTIQWSDLKLTGPQSLRDLWRQKEIGAQDTGYSVVVAPHGAELVKATPKK